MNNEILGIDDWAGNIVTDYQPATDAGVKFAYNRLGQGDAYNNTGEKNGKGDWLYKEHCEGARKAGWFNGTYWVLDTYSPYQRQLDWVIQNWPKGDDLPFCVDIEVNRNLTHEQMKKLAGNFLGAFESYYKEKPIIYTGKWYWETALSPLPEWQLDYEFWLAGYPFGMKRVACSWNDLKNTWIPWERTYPALKSPKEGLVQKPATIWQFSGDKFILPGIKGPIDLNLVLEGDLGRLTKGKKPGVGAQTPLSNTRKAQVVATVLNVREGPGIQFRVTDSKRFGDEVDILEEAGGWARIGEGQWVSKNWINMD